MSLTRFLPTPSDRMGILWNLLNIEGSVILEYGPAGTTHFSMSLFGEMDIDQQNRLFTTHMSEADVVMGDVTRLEKAIVEIDKSIHPSVIFVVASSVAAVIGVDLKGVCTYMQEQVGARLIAFDQGGFRGDYSIGLKETYTMLARTLVQKNVPRQEGTFNIIGASLWTYRVRSDIWELCGLLEEGFGLTLGTCLCADTDIEKIEKMSGAAVNLVIHGTAVSAARVLEADFGTPWLYKVPYGYKETLEWLYAVGRIVGRTLHPALEARLKEKIRMAMQYPMYGRMLKKDKMQAVLYGEYDTVTGVGDFLKSLGIDVSRMICMHSLRGIEAPREDVVYLEKEKDRMDIFSACQKAFVLADDTTMKLCDASNTTLRIAMPVIDGRMLARHLPLAGLRGADAILESVERYIQTLH